MRVGINFDLRVPLVNNNSARPSAEVVDLETEKQETPSNDASADGISGPAGSVSPHEADPIVEPAAVAEPEAPTAEVDAPEEGGTPPDEPVADQVASPEEPEPEPVAVTPTQPAEGVEKLSKRERLDRLMAGRDQLMSEIGKVIIGQEAVVEELIIVLFAGGHCLISGAPGLAKTLLIRTLAQILDLEFKRIQFTPDLMPSDITGTEIIDEDRTTGHRALRFIKGPIFTDVLLADEINRTPPKTQAALLEAMEEKQVSVAGETRPLGSPFYVFATQNPIELEGTYPLPEAQMDRFMFKILIDYLDEDRELAVAMRTTSTDNEPVRAVFTAEQMLGFRELVRMVPIADAIARYAVKLVQAGRPDNANASEKVRTYVSWGAGTRASQYIILGAKSRALLQGRLHVSLDDIRTVARPALRHRILTNFQADADGVTVEDIIDHLLESVEQPSSGL